MTTKYETIKRIICGVIILAILAFIACLVFVPRLSDTFFLKCTYKNAHPLDEQGRCYVFELKDKQKNETKKHPALKFWDMDKGTPIHLNNSRPITRVKEIRSGYYALYDYLGFQSYTLVMPYVNENMYYQSENEIQIIDCTPDRWYIDDTDSAAAKLPRDINEAENLIVKMNGDNGVCADVLIDYVYRHPGSLEYDFRKINENTDISILTSHDGKLRFYTWNTGLGGTSPDFMTYVQYNNGESIKTSVFSPFTSSLFICGIDVKRDGYDQSDGCWLASLYQINQPNGNPVYIASTYNKASSCEGGQDAYALQIIDGKLQKIPFIDNEGHETLTVGSNYSIPNWYFTTDGLGWDWVMCFDKATDTFYVPEGGDMEMSDRYDKYRLVDGKMKYVGNGAGFWLHSSLHDYKRLVGIYQTKTKFIRIDLLANGDYRYASWNKKDAMSGQPDLVMTGAHINEAENALIFVNDNYEYIVPLYRRGQGEDFGKFILKKNGKVIQESEV